MQNLRQLIGLIGFLVLVATDCMAWTAVNQAPVDDSLHHSINKRQSTCDTGCFSLCINRCANCTLANCAIRGKLDLCRVGTVNGGNLTLGNITVNGDVNLRSSGGYFSKIVFGSLFMKTVNITGNVSIIRINGGGPAAFGGHLVVGDVTIVGDLSVGNTVPEGACPGTVSNSIGTTGGTINCGSCPSGCSVDTINGVLSVGCRLPTGCNCRAYCANCG